MAGQRNTYGKRFHSQADYADNGGGKRRNVGDERDPFASAPEDTVYRYLCPERKVGIIIGRGGEIVEQLRADTQAKIKIGESVPGPGCEERVITIYSSSRETNSFEDTVHSVCPAQDALFKVHKRLVTDEAQGASQAMARLLVPSDQIGYIIGKDGNNIQGIRRDTGAQIRILKNQCLPPSALVGDELLQITGEAAVVKRALFEVSCCLHDNPSRSQHLLTSKHPLKAQAVQYLGPNAGALVMGMGPLVVPYSGYKGGTAGEWSFYQVPRDENSAKEFSLRLICPSVNIGWVSGKGGAIIKQIKQKSGASIKVETCSAEDDCIISITAKEYFEDPVSPTTDAAMFLLPRCSETTERASGEPLFTTRLLVPTSRIGCLIGKGGRIISEMRKSTRANIRIFSKENLPTFASEDDEIVEISGAMDAAKSALVQVTARLRTNVFRREGGSSALPPNLLYFPMFSNLSNGSTYGKAASQGYGPQYSAYYGGYDDSADVLLSGTYGSYVGFQGGGSGFGTYTSGYFGGFGNAGLFGPNPVFHGKHHGY